MQFYKDIFLINEMLTYNVNGIEWSGNKHATSLTIKPHTSILLIRSRG